LCEALDDNAFSVIQSGVEGDRKRFIACIPWVFSAILRGVEEALKKKTIKRFE